MPQYYILRCRVHGEMIYSITKDDDICSDCTMRKNQPKRSKRRNQSLKLQNLKTIPNFHISMANHDIIIQNHTQLKRFRNTKCEKCGKSFVINDTIHTTVKTKQGKKRYHKKCWDSKYH